MEALPDYLTTPTHPCLRCLINSLYQTLHSIEAVGLRPAAPPRRVRLQN
jgi:hypothetical protein